MLRKTKRKATWNTDAQWLKEKENNSRAQFVNCISDTDRSAMPSLETWRVENLYKLTSLLLRCVALNFAEFVEGSWLDQNNLPPKKPQTQPQ